VFGATATLHAREGPAGAGRITCLRGPAAPAALTAPTRRCSLLLPPQRAVPTSAVRRVEAAGGLTTARRSGKWTEHGTLERQVEATRPVEAAGALKTGTSKRQRPTRTWGPQVEPTARVEPAGGTRHVERGKCKEPGTLKRQVTSMCGPTRELRESI
jgi:hypothetical protein